VLRPIAGAAKTRRLLRRMKRLARLTAAAFSRSYPAMHELGLDIAVDRSLKPWILEVNTRPDPCPFSKLEDPAILARIVAYGRAYGRKYCLRCAKAKKAPGTVRLHAREQDTAVPAASAPSAETPSGLTDELSDLAAGDA
jgi:hypothetical protein